MLKIQPTNQPTNYLLSMSDKVQIEGSGSYRNQRWGKQET